ncbi:hydroxymethylbilane synthase [Candidatus Macondimonas diazotrophica]|jgi:hydroxymethylbilane synthase|uniref:Porphobilinogen deaminase n=1 Tax=Candidatus Macondimonas diazotrophica TaxID=2305248 RepID=A0A4Z0FBS8_9GAMM|nr:hydroxymethylbilane synthase [Candidatus Macondimonas diazotrophica]NCU01906.1 hydroxymethylbilane synthase [Candidatus Macondimonas diazotrophica]TFZ83989.1 hydroxymethylbilane synthase [Candidatus Macondimonas diazotrophica]
MSDRVLRIATRRSPLALWQAQHVAEQVKSVHPGQAVRLVPIKTQGDKILDVPLAKIGGKGLFIKELEQALLDEVADLAVHSMKDVPAELPDGLGLAVMLESADPRDALVSRGTGGWAGLPAGARIGTSSLRRQCQLRAQRPDLNFDFLRGNVGTRLGKLDSGVFDAIVLAAAGLDRLGLADRISERLDPSVSLPAVGQGVIGIECRTHDDALHALLAPLDHVPSRQRVTAERALNARLGGGCQVPIAGHARVVGDILELEALVGARGGDEPVRARSSGPVSAAEQIGREVAETLLQCGADRLLREWELHPQ